MSGITDEQRDENARRFGYPTQAEFEEEEAQDAARLAEFDKLAEEAAKRECVHEGGDGCGECSRCRLAAMHKPNEVSNHLQRESDS